MAVSIDFNGMILPLLNKFNDFANIILINLGKFDHDLTVLPQWNHDLLWGNHPQIAQHFRLVKYESIYPDKCKIDTLRYQENWRLPPKTLHKRVVSRGKLRRRPGFEGGIKFWDVSMLKKHQVCRLKNLAEIGHVPKLCWSYQKAAGTILTWLSAPIFFDQFYITAFPTQPGSVPIITPSGVRSRSAMQGASRAGSILAISVTGNMKPCRGLEVTENRQFWGSKGLLG